MYTQRIEKLVKTLENDPIDIAAINAGESLTYLSGLHFHLSERPTVLLIGNGKTPAIIFPEFEHEKVDHAQIDLIPFPYPENPSTWREVFQKALKYFELSQPIIGVEPTSMRYLEIDLLQNTSVETIFKSATHVLKHLRMFKDENEISQIMEAIRIAQNALQATIPFMTIGRTEKEIANELVINLFKGGSDPDLPFSPIVASGPNSANPHAVPGDRALRKGDFVVIDWGARANGYISDITRTFAMGSVNDEMKLIYQTVKNANAAARSLSAEKIIAGKIDAAARDTITSARFGEYFTHRAGHGFGLEAHEEPYITSENMIEITSGMTFTIEPGIYLPGKFGVRIEDDMLADQQGLITLTSFNRDLTIL